MRKLIAIVTGLHVLAHGVFGCCDHSVAAMTLEKVEAAHACACHHAHRHSHAAPVADVCEAVSQCPPAPVPHECAHASCHWMAGSGGIDVGSLDFFGALSVAAIVPAEMSVQLAGQFWPGDAAARFAAPPLRLHLALGVILV